MGYQFFVHREMITVQPTMTTRQMASWLAINKVLSLTSKRAVGIARATEVEVH
jgi:hypothetical protein